MTSRFAVVSHVLPPAISGQGVILHRILAGIPLERYCLVLSPGDARPGQVDESLGLASSRHALPREFRLRGTSRLSIPWLDWSVRAWQRARSLARIIQGERTSVLVSCSGDLIDIPSAVLACRWTGARLVAYYFDDYVFQWPERRERFFARSWERRLRSGYSRVIVPNEHLEADCRARGLSRISIVRNPAPDDGESGTELPWPKNPKEIEVVFTGSIYHANIGAFRTLLQAADLFQGPQVRLVAYTGQDARDLSASGIGGPRVVVRPLIGAAAVREAQNRADVLFLPLALDSSIPEVIRSSAPAKLGEYLASGRPVLAHVPAGSFVAEYLSRNNCGLVVDSKCPSMLAEAIGGILWEPARRREMVAHAGQCARRDFSAAAARLHFLRAVEGRWD